MIKIKKFILVLFTFSAIAEAMDIVSAIDDLPLVIHTTKATYINKQHANIFGVYPVKITWKNNKSENIIAYNIFRSTKSSLDFEKINKNPLSVLEKDEDILIFIDNNETAKPGIKYYYYVEAINSQGNIIFHSQTSVGYGALMHEQYMIEYNKTIKSSHKKFTLMNNPNDMKKIGSESIVGTIKGNAHYLCELKLPYARIVMHYDNFTEFNNISSDDIYFCINGYTNTTVNLLSNGKMDGTIICTGMYPGKVYYDNIEIKNGAAAGGSYGIEPEGFARKEVSWRLGVE